MTKKKISTIMLTIVLAISAIALSACNQVPEEYKIKNFYGTYNQFADDTYDVWINHIEEDVEKCIINYWQIVSVDESKFIYKDPATNENAEGEYNSELLAEVKRLMMKIGTSVTVGKKAIMLNDSATTIKYNKTIYDDHPKMLLLCQGGKDVSCGAYKDLADEKNVCVFSVYLKSVIVLDDGKDYSVSITRDFRK